MSLNEKQEKFAQSYILHRNATEAVYLNISCVPAIKTFKEGKFKDRNVHVSVFDKDWWVKKIAPIWNVDTSIKTYITLDTKEGKIGMCLKKKGESDGTNSTDRTSNLYQIQICVHFYL